MGSEFFINSQELEDKVRQLLPSQGGAGAGFDLSASTQIIPIIDLTESAEGSNLRADLQTSFSHDNMTSFSVQNATNDLITNTGFFRIFGQVSFTGSATGTFKINDGASDKVIMAYKGASGLVGIEHYDFMIKMSAGDTFSIISNSANIEFDGTSRQIASIDGELV